MKEHPLVKQLFELRINSEISFIDLAAASGVDRSTIQKWKSGRCPTVGNLEACLNVLGHDLVVQIDGK